jgi:hypothetical protein
MSGRESFPYKDRWAINIKGESEPPVVPELLEPAEEEVATMVEPVAAPLTVRVGSLQPGRQFEYGGKLYHRMGMMESQVLGIRLVEKENQAFLIPDDRVLLNEDALVIPK